MSYVSSCSGRPGVAFGQPLMLGFESDVFIQHLRRCQAAMSCKAGGAWSRIALSHTPPNLRNAEYARHTSSRPIEGFGEDDELEIPSLWDPEALVVERKRSGFTRARVTATLVPWDQVLALPDDGHLHASRAEA